MNDATKSAVPPVGSRGPHASFASRHIGPSDADVAAMLAALGAPSLDALIDDAVPAAIRTRAPLDIPPPLSEHELLARMRALAAENQPFRSFLGLGWHETLTPPVILRNILEDPGWYTAYTPYQAEVSQGRLEMLLTWQTVVSDLTGLPVANASLLDEATAAAEAMAMAVRVMPGARAAAQPVFRVDERCHPQTLGVVATRAEALGVAVEAGRWEDFTFGPADEGRLAGVLVQSPDTRGRLHDLTALAAAVHAVRAQLVVAADPLALTLFRPPGEQGADVVVGSAQRLGVPMGWGGPHAAFLATRDGLKRQVPGRIIGLSVDAQGRPALRMALQTREQHIRREKATSNICTAQVLLAAMAAAYAVWHGPEGLTAIAAHVHGLAAALAAALRRRGHAVEPGPRFDAVACRPAGRSAAAVLAAAADRGMNLRDLGDGAVGVSFGEPATAADVDAIAACFGGDDPGGASQIEAGEPAAPARTTPFLTHEVFRAHRREHSMLRYLTRLRNRDVSLAHSMIPLGSCTMKLNATAEMMPVTWPELSDHHPFAPADQVAGWRRIVADLEGWLSAITGYDAISLQPNAGSQGEYAGLLVIRAFHRDRGQGRRNVCLIPASAHGTNPASAALAGMTVAPVRCDDAGDIDVSDLREKAAAHSADLAALMVTYPSTHGVYEEGIRDICEAVHAHGGQVYMDGANMNALVGLSRPAEFGADVLHLNLHKTFCIPHGGGGPGMGPIGVRAHLAPYLPTHPVVPCNLRPGGKAIGPVSAAPYGSPGVLPIPWAYIAMMGGEGLTRATRTAILSANYVAHRLHPHFPVVYRGRTGRVAHECIVDLRPLKATAGVTPEDVAKRLMDFGFHAPTISFPVAGTMMIEPTESEPLEELDRFCDAMIAIRGEIAAIEAGRWRHEESPLAHAPHTAEVVAADAWTRPYGREQAAFPLPWVRERKVWPSVGRVDGAYGDRHLVCAWPCEEAPPPGP